MSCSIETNKFPITTKLFTIFENVHVECGINQREINSNWGINIPIM